MIRLAFFITSHGLGHAARALAVMEELLSLDSQFFFEIFTTVPEFFFRGSLKNNYTYHYDLTDPGLVQKGPFEEDLPATIRLLQQQLPFKKERVDELAKRTKYLGVKLILSDISPLAIASARQAGIRSVLIENFTWDWIYQGYAGLEPNFSIFQEYLSEIFQLVDFHIQTEPVCGQRNGDLITPPVCRRLREGRKLVRKKLSLSENSRTILVSMGGVRAETDYYKLFSSCGHLVFLITGCEQKKTRDNFIYLPVNSDIHHQDLINSSDLVIGKLGYSTLAEVYQAGTPFGYIPRTKFSESQILAKYVKQNMVGFPITEVEFSSGSWLNTLPQFTYDPKPACRENGSKKAAEFILGLIS